MNRLCAHPVDALSFSFQAVSGNLPPVTILMRDSGRFTGIFKKVLTQTATMLGGQDKGHEQFFFPKSFLIICTNRTFINRSPDTPNTTVRLGCTAHGFDVCRRSPVLGSSCTFSRPSRNITQTRPYGGHCRTQFSTLGKS